VNLIPRTIAKAIAAFSRFKQFLSAPSKAAFFKAWEDFQKDVDRINNTDFLSKGMNIALDYIDKKVKNIRKSVSDFGNEFANSIRQTAAAEARLRKKRQQDLKYGGLARPVPEGKELGLSEEQVKSLERAVNAYMESLARMRMELQAISSIPTGKWANDLYKVFGTDWVNRYVQALIEVKNTYKDLNERTWPEFKKRTGVAAQTLEEFINAQVRLRLTTEASRKSLEDTTSAFEAYSNVVKEASRAQQSIGSLLSGGKSALDKLRQRFEVEDQIKNIDINVFNKQLEAAGMSPVKNIEELKARWLELKQVIQDSMRFEEIFEELTPEVDKINQRFDEMRQVILRVVPASDELRDKMLKNLEEMRQKALEAADPIAQMANQIGDAFGRAFEDAIIEGRKLSDVLKQLEKDILRIVTRKLITEPLGDFISGAIKGGLSGIFQGAFAHGGEFKVGGVGGIDSQLVAFWATPGETVTITPPGKDAPSRNMNVTININTPTGTVDPQSLGQIQAALARAVQRGGRNL